MNQSRRWARMGRFLLLIAAGLIMTGVLLLIFRTTSTYAIDENNCLSCHGNPDLVKTNEQGIKISLYVNPRDVDGSAHRYIDCTTCHTKNPHAVKTLLNKISQAELCSSCHQYQGRTLSESIHGEPLAKGNLDVPTCADCHSPDGNPHSVIRVLEFTAPIYQANIAQTCGKCHNNEELMSSYGIVENVYLSYMKSFHGKTLQLNSQEIARLDVATCVSCHGAHDIKSVTDPTSPVAGMDNLLKTCQQCHSGAERQFIAGFVGHKDASPQNIPVVYYAEIFFKILLITVLAFGALVVLMAIVRFSIKRWRE